MIGFIGTLVTIPLNHFYYSAIADLHFIIHCYTHTHTCLLLVTELKQSL
jgi:hypothetical protein